MAYSSFVVEHIGRSVYTDLELEVRVAASSGKPVYLVNVGKDKHRVGRRPFIDMGDSIDLIVKGTLGQVKNYVKKLNCQAGIVCYTGQHIGELHAQATIALDIATEEGKKYHMYRPGAD